MKCGKWSLQVCGLLNLYFSIIVKYYVKKDIFIILAVNVEGIWKDLYDNFKVAYQKQKLQPSGSGAHENNISCEFYENLLFLADHIEHRPPVSSLPKCLNLQGNTRSIWQNSTNGEKVSQGINKKVKVPEWDHHAKLKYQKQENAFNVLADVSNTIKETSLKVIQAISQEEPATQNINTQSNIEKDYFNIYYDNLIKVNNEQRDDCVLAIVECIEECMK